MGPEILQKRRMVERLILLLLFTPSARHPWTRFPSGCPVSAFLHGSRSVDWDRWRFWVPSQSDTILNRFEPWTEKLTTNCQRLRCLGLAFGLDVS